MIIPLCALLALQQTPVAPPIARVVVTPSSPTVVAGDSLQLRAQALDAQGRPVPGARILFAPTGASFEGSVDTAGFIRAGAVGVMPVTAVAMPARGRPVTQRVEVRIVPGPAARIALAPSAAKILAGQTLRVAAAAYSAAGDRRSDRLEWASASAAVARVTDGVVTGVAPGRTTISARAGAAHQSLVVEVLSSNVSSVEVVPGIANARTGDVVRFSAVVKDRAGAVIAGLTPTWFVSPGEGLIDDGGAFVGNRAGTYHITANFGSRTADATVTLAPREAQRPVTMVGRVSRSAFSTSEVWIHPNGRVAYLGTNLGGDRVYAIDIANPSMPTIADSIVINARSINDVMATADGNYLVMTREGADNRRNGIAIADIRDPLHPKALSEFSEGVTSGVHSAFVHTQPKYGTHVYLTNDGTGALHIVDINDPAKPTEASQWKPRLSSGGGLMLHDIDVQNGLLYASWWNDGLVILDVGNGVKGGTPQKPVLVSQFKYDLDSLYRRAAIHSGQSYVRGTHTAWRHKNYVFIADEVFGLGDLMAMQGGHSRAFGRLHVLDVSNLEQPKMVAWYEPEYGGVHNIWVAGDTLYMGAYNAGFKAFDVSGELRGDLLAQGRLIGDYLPLDPKGRIPNMPMTWGVVVNPKDGLAYVPDMNSGMWILKLEPKPAVVP